MRPGVSSPQACASSKSWGKCGPGVWPPAQGAGRPAPCSGHGRGHGAYAAGWRRCASTRGCAALLRGGGGSARSGGAPAGPRRRCWAAAAGAAPAACGAASALPAPTPCPGALAGASALAGVSAGCLRVAASGRPGGVTRPAARACRCALCCTR